MSFSTLNKLLFMDWVVYKVMQIFHIFSLGTWQYSMVTEMYWFTDLFFLYGTMVFAKDCPFLGWSFMETQQILSLLSTYLQGRLTAQGVYFCLSLPSKTKIAGNIISESHFNVCSCRQLKQFHMLYWNEMSVSAGKAENDWLFYN